MYKEDVVVIETNIMFDVDIKVNVKVKKITSYANSQPQYKLVQMAGVIIQSDESDETPKMKDIIRNIEDEAFLAVRKHEREIYENAE